MILELKIDVEKWEPESKQKWPSIFEKWFSENGKFDGRIEDETEYKDGKSVKIGNKIYPYSARFVGHIDHVPIEILNSSNAEIEFFKPLVAFVSNTVDRHSPADLKDSCKGAVTIHLPSNELMQINDVFFQENCCTDQLQLNLDDGYRIIACIPRPGQRRPDYILGKNKNKELKNA